MEDTLITIGDDFHWHFHQFMGGTDKSVTPEDMRKFIDTVGQSYFPDNDFDLFTIEAHRRLSLAGKATEIALNLH